MQKTRLLMLGGGGHASDILSLVEALNSNAETYEVIGIYDNNASETRFVNRGVKIFKDIEDEIQNISTSLGHINRFIPAVGYPQARMKLVANAIRLGLSPCNPLVHPHATNLATGVSLGAGTIVLSNTSINVAAQIRGYCYISHGCLIGHDVLVEEGCSLMPGVSISGDVLIGKNVLVGAGAIVLQGLQIGSDAKIGAGSVVTKNVCSGSTVVGIPAKAI